MPSLLLKEAFMEEKTEEAIPAEPAVEEKKDPVAAATEEALWRRR